MRAATAPLALTQAPSQTPRAPASSTHGGRRGGRREYRVRWRDGRESWEEYSSDYGTLTLTLTPTPTPIPTPTRYSADYVEKLSGFDSYVAGVRLAARQGKTPPQRKKPAAEVNATGENGVTTLMDAIIWFVIAGKIKSEADLFLGH